MGRPQKKEFEKKNKVSITISPENYESLANTGINKSQLINWLLEQHFGLADGSR